MTSYPRILLYTLLATLGGLLGGCVLVGLVIGLYSQLSSAFSFSAFAAGWAFGLFLAMFAVMYGLLPALLFGAPTYSLLFKLGRANYLTATVIGTVLGLALLLVRPEIGPMFLLFGIPVAWCTHFLVKRCPPLHRMGANNSFKPNPLRGSA